MSSIGRMAQKHNTVSTTDMARRNTQALPRMRSAFALSPRPMAMEASGAPPMPARKEKDEMIRMMGKATPSPGQRQWANLRYPADENAVDDVVEEVDDLRKNARDGET